MIGARLVHPSLALGREYLELLRETDRVDIGWNEGPQAKAVEHDLDSHIASLNERAYRIGVLNAFHRRTSGCCRPLGIWSAASASATNWTTCSRSTAVTSATPFIPGGAGKATVAGRCGWRCGMRAGRGSIACC
jgi:hypothetical protein